MKLISVKNISKSFQTKGGVKNLFEKVTLDIMRGENIGILGRNGVGKSTFLRIIAGIEDPDYGVVTRQARISWPIGFTGGFNGTLSGQENCHFIARIYGEQIDSIVDFVEEFAELGNYFYMPFKTYSSGMKARLAFAISMALEFDLYLVDEVMAVGDIEFQMKCRNAFSARRQRANLIMVSHNQATLKEYCTSIAILQNNDITLYKDMDQAFKIYNQGF